MKPVLLCKPVQRAGFTEVIPASLVPVQMLVAASGCYLNQVNPSLAAASQGGQGGAAGRAAPPPLPSPPACNTGGK